MLLWRVLKKGGGVCRTDLNADSRLIVLVGRENLGLLDGDVCVSFNDLGHHTTSGLNTHG